MNHPSPTGRPRQRPRPEIVHRLSVGSTVRMRTFFATSPDSDRIYRITGTLPPRDNLPQYRIRCDEERHERITTEDNLEAL